MNRLFLLLMASGWMMTTPQDILRVPPPPPGERIPYGMNPLQFGELRLPHTAGPHPVVIVIHGGFWRAAYNLDHISHLCVALNSIGLATWSLEYRRIGDEGGGWPGTFQDVSAGTDYLRSVAAKNSLDLNRIVILGHSAGGHLALWTGARRNFASDHPLYVNDPIALRGIVALAGVSNLRQAFDLKLSNTVVADLLGGTPESVSDRYRAGSPSELLPLGIPQRLIHGTLDTNVPVAISQDYVTSAKSRGDDAQFIALEGARHFEVIDPRSKEFEVVKRTILELVR